MLLLYKKKKEEEMSRQRAMITFPFRFSSKTFSSSSCAVSWNSLHNSQDGLYLKYSRLDYFGHNSSRLLLCVIFLPLQLRDEDDAVFGMPILCRGRTVHFPESKKKKKKGDPIVVAGERCTLIHTDTQNTDVVA